MRVTGIISEYNPFHEGHKYHMKKTKKITNADYVIVVMSGNFTQRGTPAIMDKYSRARQALLNGADLVLELPVCFAAASAEYFAFGGVSLLHKLGVVDYLSFGSEEGNLALIKNIAAFLSDEPKDYKEKLQSYLKQGCSYPKARELCLREYFPALKPEFLSQPNNILGIEYCRALSAFHSAIEPVTIARIHNQYHDTRLSPNGSFSSASAIRRVMENAGSSDVSGQWKNADRTKIPTLDRVQFSSGSRNDSSDLLYDLHTQLPASVYEMIQEQWQKSMPVFSDDFSLLLKYKLLLESSNSFFKSFHSYCACTRDSDLSYGLSRYADINSDLADRIKNHLNRFQTFEAFCQQLKTKELTYSRISRGLFHILLEIKESDLQNWKNAGYTPYARILGFRKEASPLLHEIKKHSSIPLISKLSDSVKTLENSALSMLEKDIFASHIYETVVADKFGGEFQNEFQRQLIII